MEGNQETALAVRGPGAVFSFAPRNMDEAARFCDALAKSDLVPKNFQGKPANVMLAVQMGAELGLQPMQAIQSIAVINGRPSVWGDGLLGIVQASGLLESFVEAYDPATKTATCTVKRKGWTAPIVGSFSWAEAENVVVTTWDNGSRKQSKLTDKDTYRSYPKRMLQMRARTFALRDAFADVLRGLTSREEAEDLPVLEVDGDGAVKVADTAAMMPRRAGESATPAAAASSAPTAAPSPAVVEAELVQEGSTASSASVAASSAEPTARSEQAERSESAPTGESRSWGPYLVPKYAAEGSEEWVGLIVEVRPPASDAERRYSLIGQDARKFGTFSKSLADAAAAFVGKGEPLRITFVDTDYGRDVKTVQARAGVAAPMPAAPADAPKRRGRPAATASAPTPAPAPEPPAPTPQSLPAEAFDDDPPPPLISQSQKAELVALFNAKQKTPAIVKDYLRTNHGVEKLADLPEALFESVKRWATA